MRDPRVVQPPEGRRFVLATVAGCALLLAWQLLAPRCEAPLPERADDVEPAAGTASRGLAEAVSAGAPAIAPGERTAIALTGFDDDAASVPPRRAGPPRTERAWHEHFVAVGRRDAAELAQCADAVLEDGPDSRRFALLRALRDVGSPATAPVFVHAATRPGAGEDVAVFVVRIAGERAARESWAREVLRELAFGERRIQVARHRNAASASYAAAATPAELASLAALVLRAGDAELAHSVVAALSDHPAAADAERVAVVLRPLTGERTLPTDGADRAPEKP